MAGIQADRTAGFLDQGPDPFIIIGQGFDAQILRGCMGDEIRQGDQIFVNVKSFSYLLLALHVATIQPKIVPTPYTNPPLLRLYGMLNDISPHHPYDVYQPRNPRNSQYYRCVEAHFEELEAVWDDRYERR